MLQAQPRPGGVRSSAVGKRDETDEPPLPPLLLWWSEMSNSTLFYNFLFYIVEWDKFYIYIVPEVIVFHVRSALRRRQDLDLIWVPHVIIDYVNNKLTKLYFCGFPSKTVTSGPDSILFNTNLAWPFLNIMEKWAELRDWAKTSNSCWGISVSKGMDWRYWTGKLNKSRRV